MNKYMIFAGVAALATLASCSNNETVDAPKGYAIGFRSMIDKNQTRGAQELKTDNLSAFKVWGYAADDLNFDGVEVAKEEEATDFTYSPLQYWEAGKEYAFTAVGSSSGKTCSAVYTKPTSKPTDVKDGFGSFEFDNKAAEGNEDVCYAVKTVESKASIGNTEDAVDLEFKHALSRVKFTFENNLTGAYKLTVKDIKIDNAASKGSFDVAKAEWKNDTETFALAFDAISAEIENTKDGATDHQYILPSGEQKLTISFTLVSIVNGNETEYKHENVAISLADNSDYEAGHSYNFKAVIDAKNLDPKNELVPIEFSATVKEWENDTDNNVTVKTKGNKEDE